MSWLRLRNTNWVVNKGDCFQKGPKRKVEKLLYTGFQKVFVFCQFTTVLSAAAKDGYWRSVKFWNWVPSKIWHNTESDKLIFFYHSTLVVVVGGIVSPSFPHTLPAVEPFVWPGLSCLWPLFLFLAFFLSRCSLFRYFRVDHSMALFLFHTVLVIAWKKALVASSAKFT